MVKLALSAVPGTDNIGHDHLALFLISLECPTNIQRDIQLTAGYTSCKCSGGLRVAVYLCPMHPEVKQDGPGSCPKCGMALEPKDGAVDLSKDHEYQNFKKRTFLGTLLLLPLMFLAMGSMFGWVHSYPSTQLVISTIIVFYCGAPLLIKAAQSMTHASPNMFTLIALGTLAAYFFSATLLFFPHLFPQQTVSEHSYYFEAAGMIIVLVLLGQVLELKARASTKSALQDLNSLKPQQARLLLDDGSMKEVHICQVKLNATLFVKPGEAIPVDGRLLRGVSTVNEVMLNGEAMPVTKKAGDPLHAGTINLDGSFSMQATAIGKDTTLAQILELVSQAQLSQAPMQKLADNVSRVFIPVVVVSALVAMAAWFAFGPPPQLSFALVAAVSVLIIACPCALGLATPMSVVVATGRAAKRGILIKDASVFERLNQIDTIALDKTGTLTEARFIIRDVMSTPSYNKEDLLKIAASVEIHSEHPLAKSVVAAAQEKKLTLWDVTDFKNMPGYGVQGKINERSVKVGRASFVSAVGDEATTYSSLHISVDGTYAGRIDLQDKVRSESAALIDQIKKLGIEVLMLTGDRAASAHVVARQVGISRVHAGLLPEEKLKIIATLQRSGKKVAMVGDGINDAPALAQADLGIAVASGTDIAKTSAEIVLLKPALSTIVEALNLGRETVRNMKQNLFFAFAYNALGIPVAAGILYPLTGNMLSPMIAGAAMSVSSLSVILNALRLRWRAHKVRSS